MDKTLEQVQSKPRAKDMTWKSFFFYLVLIILFRVYVIEPHSVSGSSMDETFHTKDYVLVDKISYYFTEPKRGEVIVFNPPVVDRTQDRFIKRIIAIPGDSVVVTSEGTFINGEKQIETFVTHGSDRPASTTLKADEYFVMGDNREVSYDSRSWGILKKEHIQGRVIFRLFPLGQIGLYPGSIK